MTEHELQQMQDYEDKCIKETEGWLCHECAKKLDYVVEEKEITNRMIEEFWEERGENFNTYWRVSAEEVIEELKRWLDKQQTEERDQRISDYTGG